MKKLFLLFAALCCMMVANAATGDVFTDANGIKYKVTSENYKTVDVVANNNSGSVVIPATVTYGEVTYNVTSIGDAAFYGCSKLSSIEIPASVTSIGYEAFYDCSSLEEVTFADGSQLSKIDKTAFSACESLKSIEIPASVTSIGQNAFSGCSSLATVTFAKGSKLSEINSYAFRNCSKLSSIEIPASVTTIKGAAFNGCNNLTSVTVHWTTPLSINSGTFNGISSSATLNVPFGTETMYKSANVWKDFATITDSFFDLNVSAVGWASMYLPCAVTIPSGAEVYYASAASGSQITLTQIYAGTTIAAKTAVLVKGAEGTASFPIANEAGTSYTGNLFKGTLVDIPKTEDVYVLSGVGTTGNPQFQNYTGTTLGAHKIWLPKSAVGGSTGAINFVFDDATAINGMDAATPKSSVRYNLNGQAVGADYKGIVIVNGKKYINK